VRYLYIFDKKKIVKMINISKSWKRKIMANDKYTIQEKKNKNKKRKGCHDNYPSQSSRRLKCYIEKKYGGLPNCVKATRIVNDSDAPHYYRKAAAWYKNLHCKGKKQIREDDPTHKSEGSALTIFDLDDTLVVTQAKHKVIRPGKSTLILNDKQKESYVLKPGEKFDDSDFQSSEKFHDTAKPIENIMKKAQHTLRSIGKRPSSRIVVVTARKKMDDSDLFMDSMEKLGLDMSKIHVYYAGNLKKGTSDENKKSLIRNLIISGPYTEVRLFDDKLENLEAFLKLKIEFPDVKFSAYPVLRNGKMGKPIIV
jgi:hypothetical protein